jgi:hypothetical protein
MKSDPVSYRGIDFVLKTRADSKALTDELTEHVIFNRVWKRMRTIVLSGPGRKAGAEAQINAFCDLIEDLSRQSKVCWKSCSLRIIDIGFDSGIARPKQKFVPLELQFSPLILKRIQSLGCTMAITIYPCSIGKPKKVGKPS